MKTILFALLSAALLAAPAARAAQANDDDSPAAHQHGTDEGSGQQAHDPARHLQLNMKTMHDVMARIRDATDPEEKRRLLKVHMLAMQEQIRTIRTASAGGHDHAGEAGEGKGGEGKGGDAKDGGMKKGGMMGGGMMKMHKKMEQRTEALEQLLEQLIEHEAAEDGLQSR
jgi:hypothetical protein